MPVSSRKEHVYTEKLRSTDPAYTVTKHLLLFDNALALTIYIVWLDAFNISVVVTGETVSLGEAG